MPEYEGPSGHEQKFNPQVEWYYDDESVSDLYVMIKNNEISKEEARKLLSEVQAQFQNLDSRSDKTGQEVDKMGILNNIANQLVIEVGFDSSQDNQKPDAPQELEGTH